MFDRLNSGEMLCLMRELTFPKAASAECFTLTSAGGDGLTGGRTVWLGGGSSAQRLGSITSMDLDANTVSTQVRA